jgi:hypothetical protein
MSITFAPQPKTEKKLMCCFHAVCKPKRKQSFSQKSVYTQTHTAIDQLFGWLFFRDYAFCSLDEGLITMSWSVIHQVQSLYSGTLQVLESTIAESSNEYPDHEARLRRLCFKMGMNEDLIQSETKVPFPLVLIGSSVCAKGDFSGVCGKDRKRSV